MKIILGQDEKKSRARKTEIAEYTSLCLSLFAQGILFGISLPELRSIARLSRSQQNRIPIYRPLFGYFRY
jgi:hypothetical protein